MLLSQLSLLFFFLGLLVHGVYFGQLLVDALLDAVVAVGHFFHVELRLFVWQRYEEMVNRTCKKLTLVCEKLTK